MQAKNKQANNKQAHRKLWVLVQANHKRLMKDIISCPTQWWCVWDTGIKPTQKKNEPNYYNPFKHAGNKADQ